MAKYKLQNNGVLDTETGASIPNASGNRHWQEYLEWVALGNVADPEKTVEQIEAERVASIKQTAGLKIVAMLPEWKQRNLLARSVELQNKVLGGTALTVEEQGELDAIQALWDKVKTIRLISDNAEVQGTQPQDVDWTV